MKLAIDLPVKYSDLDIGDITFCLAPLLNRQDDTGRKYMAAMANLQKNGRQIMLDNGAWEFGASMDSQEYMDIISILEPTWAVIPDVMGSVNKSISLARDFIPDLVQLDNRPKLMFAPQGGTMDDLIECYNAVMDDYSKFMESRNEVFEDMVGRKENVLEKPNIVETIVESKEEELELRFEKEASKRLGGSMVYVSKRKINWDLKN